tara:strand:+ start:1771 stop:2067 length:297 start_codon:yes stop_codon:yes gene_type:complete
MNDELNYERLPADKAMDETDISLRAYLAGLEESHLSKYNPSWTDDQVIAWDGNFRDDGALMLVCCERDVEIEEFRQVLVEHMQFRQISPVVNPETGDA